MKIKLSRVAIEMLVLIADNSVIEDGGIFWHPHPSRSGEYSDSFERRVIVSGSGVARVIKSLWAKGLAKRVTLSTASLNPYASRITEEGRLHVERLRESGGLTSI